MTPGMTHPEDTCERCGGRNLRWHAPSPLWNAVMRDPATGLDEWSIVCPRCFAALAEANGIAPPSWHFGPDADVSHLWEDRDGRRWDPTSCLWVAGEQRVLFRYTAAGGIERPRSDGLNRRKA